MGRKLGGHTIRVVAKHFNRDPVAITQGMKKVEAKLREESDFKKAVEKIEKRLTKNKKKYLITYAPFTLSKAEGPKDRLRFTIFTYSTGF